MTSTKTVLFVVFALILTEINATLSRDDEYKWPTVIIATLARNKGHSLPYFLTHIKELDYPKDRIALWIHSDNNVDNTVDVLKKWLSKYGHSYHSVYHNLDSKMDDSLANDTIGDWSDARFQHVIRLREAALKYAKKIWADFLFMIDADVYITEPSTLKELTAKNLDVVAPMLKSEGLYSNFWAGMSNDYYYQRTDNYTNILNRVNISCFSVPMVHTAVLINLRRSVTNRLTYEPNNIDDYRGPLDDIISFAISANLSGIDLNVCNDKIYGYMMVPLEVGENIDNDHMQLTNLKVQSVYNDYAIRSDRIFDRDVKTQPVDTMGFDRIFMINLKRRTDRKEKMDLCFKELGIDYSLINAVDGRSMNDVELENWGVKLMPNYADPYHDRPMTFGEIGCFLSHYLIWKEVVTNKHNKVMVLEDDLYFETYFRGKVKVILEEIEKNNIEWDLIYLGRKRLRDDDESKVSPNLVKAGYSYWTLAYLLSYNGAKKLIGADPLGNLLPVDEFLPIMSGSHPNDSWSGHFKRRDLIVLSAQPLLIFPTHYTGESGYISDTENSVMVTSNLPAPHDDL